MIEIYTDGGCRPTNPGPGAHAIVVVMNGAIIHEACDTEENSTNNRMELWAMIKALTYANISGHVCTIYTDSQYVQKGLTQWLSGWITRNWVKADGKPVLNKDLWVKLNGFYQANPNHRIVWIKGHANNPWNNRADELCTQALQKDNSMSSGTDIIDEKHLFKIGDEVTIVADDSGHHFRIGSKVIVHALEWTTNGSAYYKCFSTHPKHNNFILSVLQSDLEGGVKHLTDQVPDNVRQHLKSILHGSH